MELEFGESYIYYIEIVRYIDKRLDSVWKVKIKEKTNNIREFEKNMENEINAKLKHKISIQAAAKRCPTHEEYFKNVKIIGEYYINELQNGGCTYGQLAEKFKITKSFAQTAVCKYFIIKKMGVTN